MSRGRHALPEPPRSDVPLVALALIVASAAIVAVWLVDDSIAVAAGVTGVVAVLVVFLALSLRSTHQVASAIWQEAMDRRAELLDLHREMSELRTQHLELLLELRALRAEVATSTEDTARNLLAASDQRALIQDLLIPRQPVADPIYPSLHLPLVRAAFSAELATEVPTQPSAGSGQSKSAEISGAEAFPPRQLLDLTASEIARLRPAN